MNSAFPGLTQILVDASGERPADVAKKLMPLVYDELRELAARYLRSERRGHTLQPTALVHETFVRLVDQSRVDWKRRTHFYAVGAIAEDQGHHSEVSLAWGRVRVEIWTHKVDGLTKSDFILAARIDDAQGQG